MSKAVQFDLYGGIEVLEVRERQSVVLGYLGQRNRVIAGAPGQLDHHAHAVLGLG